MGPETNLFLLALQSTHFQVAFYLHNLDKGLFS